MQGTTFIGNSTSSASGYEINQLTQWVDFTPTVGLGCRSGGYLIYFVIALGNFLLETIIWWQIPEATNTQAWIRRRRARISTRRFTTYMEQRLDRVDSNRWRWMTTARSLAHQGLRWWNNATLRDRFEVTVLRFCDVFNSTWLAFLVCAQTFGADRNCECFSAHWGSGGVRSTLPIQTNHTNGFGRDTSISRQGSALKVAVSEHLIMMV